jgi:CubicO group peptidase (beta-lactamase class C family)
MKALFEKTLKKTFKKLFNRLFAIICVTLAMNTSIVFGADDAEIIQQLIEHKITEQNNALGVSVAIIEKDKIKYFNFGLVNKQEKQKTTPKSLFEIGSISKTFTSMALSSMVNEGKVKLKDPVQKYLPAEVKLPTRNGQVITLESLANHTSGLPRLPNNMPFSDPLDPYADYTVEMMYEFLKSYELTQDIGEKVDYSNLAVGLLGHVLGLIDNKTYQQVITDRVLKPLNMQDTFVDVPASHMKLLSDGHDASLNKAKHWQLPTLAGAGAIKSNITDMALYLKANLNQKPLGDVIALTHKLTTNAKAQGASVGLAWFISEHKNGAYLWHNGGTGGFRSFMGFDQKNKKGIVILENTVNGMDALGNAYLTGTLAKLKSDTLDVVTVEESKLKRLNGHYELVPGFIMHVTNDAGQLYIQATGQGRFPVTAKSELEFVNVEAQARITFELDSAGDAKSLTLHQGGASRVALKLAQDKIPAEKPKVELTTAQLDNLVGVFQLMPNFAITTTHEEGQLIIQATGQQKIAFETNSKNEFFNAQVQAKIVFELDENGKVLSLTLFQGGQELKGSKK